jgi:hypothetical protein
MFGLGLLPSILLGVSAAGAVASGVAALDQPKSPAAPTSTQTQTEQAEAAQAAAQAQATALTKRRGMASTIMTSPLGVGNAPNTQRSTLGA